MKKIRMDKYPSKMKSAIANDADSRNSVHGYLETGNPEEVHEKARALRNNDNRSHI